jgi:hypothetical protein
LGEDLNVFVGKEVIMLSPLLFHQFSLKIVCDLAVISSKSSIAPTGRR